VRVNGNGSSHGSDRLRCRADKPSAPWQVLQKHSILVSLRYHTKILSLVLFALTNIPLCGGFLIRDSRQYSDSRMTIQPTNLFRPTKSPRSNDSYQVLTAVDVEHVLEMEWMPIVQDLQRNVRISNDSCDFSECETDDSVVSDGEGLESTDDANDCQGEFGLEVDDLADHIAKRAARAALLKSRYARPSQQTTPRPTSIGARRIGTATKERPSTILMDTLRSRARGAAAAAALKDELKETTKGAEHDATMKITTSVIHKTVASMLRHGSQSTFSLIGKTMGILGEPKVDTLPETVLCQADVDADVIVRLASPRDDMNIAGLRLSVFSAFPPDVQNQFRTRSCQAIHNRRLRGAVCVVATIKDLVVGGAECSFDEFSGTRLGRRRLPYSVLYVTEVAVNPLVRRRGIGTKLLQAVDKIAEARNVESLYLHVEVKNEAAIRLYHMAGYQLAGNDQMFLEFTTSLNLHPGATKGREHYLLCKHMHGKQPTWLPDTASASQSVKGSRGGGSLGFEIPA
jgi:GNAT superfamily N-acetyltransferase